VKLSHSPAAAELKPAEATTPSGSPIAPSSTPANPKPAPPAAENNPIVAPGGAALPATAPPLPASAAPPATGGGAPQAQGPARVHFQPSQVDTDLGSNITVSLVVDGGTDVASAPMIVTWDPKVLSLNSVNQGDLLARGGQQPVFNKNVQNDQGRASVQIGVMPNSPGVTAPTGTLVTFTFQAVGRGATHVTIPELNVRNSQGGTVVAGSPQLTVNVK